MIKLTLEELKQRKDKWKTAVIVFDQKSFDGNTYTHEERSYKVSSDAKWFDDSMIGMSLIGNCLDGIDLGVRLDLYMRLLPSEGTRWIVEYCYIVE
jgi:hypothetical protein